jgi:LL-diaminopimelate aminotransferase
MPRTTARYQTLPEYLLASMPQKKRDLIAKGVDVIDLGAGDADLAPPAEAVEALEKAAHNPSMSRYGFGLGLPAFREAVSRWMQRRFGLTFDPMKEVVPLIGSKEGIAHLALAYVGAGDVALIPEPGYLAYLGGSLLSEGDVHTVALRPRTNFLLELDDVPVDVLRRTRLVYLNYPNNPTAAIAPRDYLERTVKHCREYDILLVYDNAYSELAFDGYVPPSIFEIAGAREVAIEFHSLSKTYNMTGWRVGWACGNPALVAGLGQVKTNVDSGVFEAVQRAAIAALTGDQAPVARQREIYKERRDVLCGGLTAAGFDVLTPKASFYTLVANPTGMTSLEFAARLLTEAGIVATPATGFGPSGEGFVRLTVCADKARLAEAVQRLTSMKL